jgi:hypothetical protein
VEEDERLPLSANDIDGKRDGARERFEFILGITFLHGDHHGIKSVPTAHYCAYLLASAAYASIIPY